MPFVDVAGNTGAVLPVQIVVLVPNVKAGVKLGFTVTVKVAGTAHNPAAGVNVYVPEFMLSTTAGLHVPLIEFVDVPGNAGTDPPSHTLSAVPKVKAGVIFGFTVTTNVTGVEHNPAVGVKV
jgi:hypothetical protein